MTKKHVAWTIALLFCLSGCYKATFYRDSQVVRGIEQDQWNDFFIFGLVGREVIDVNAFCGGKPPSEVATGGNFATGLVSALTLGIYTPRKVYVTCAAEPNAVASTTHYTIVKDGDGVPTKIFRWQRGKSQEGRLAAIGKAQWRVSFEKGGAL